jgi:Fic family protein
LELVLNSKDPKNLEYDQDEDRPSVSVAKPPDVRELIATLDGARVRAVLKVQQMPQGKYRHWHKLRYLKPPGDLSHEEWWLALKLARGSMLKSIPLCDAAGEHFAYATPDNVLRLLHYVDRHCSGEIATAEVVTTDEHARHRYLVNSLMEEAIRSSQLEGATTTRMVAKELLRSGRPPRDRSERMILNNYRALEFIREGMGDRLTPELVLELHRVLTEGTLDVPGAAGRLQTPSEERVAVVDARDDTVVHVPPPAEQLPARLQAMCDFANHIEDDSDHFIHPVLKAILLHFWLAYDHPFEDGNGRTARALFYWSMRVQGYWLVEYLSISRILRKAPAQYGRSFVLTETDGGDTTYFILYQLEVIERAVRELHEYLTRKVREVQDLKRLLDGAADLNHRQLALLSDAVRHPNSSYTYQSHATDHKVTQETARADLSRLREQGLLKGQKMGRKHLFVPAANLAEALRDLPNANSK